MGCIKSLYQGASLIGGPLLAPSHLGVNVAALSCPKDLVLLRLQLLPFFVFVDVISAKVGVLAVPAFDEWWSVHSNKGHTRGKFNPKQSCCLQSSNRARRFHAKNR